MGEIVAVEDTAGEAGKTIGGGVAGFAEVGTFVTDGVGAVLVVLVDAFACLGLEGAVLEGDVVAAGAGRTVARAGQAGRVAWLAYYCAGFVEAAQTRAFPGRVHSSVGLEHTFCAVFLRN